MALSSFSKSFWLFIILVYLILGLIFSFIFLSLYISLSPFTFLDLFHVIYLFAYSTNWLTALHLLPL